MKGKRMQWVMQEFNDTKRLIEALDRLGIEYSLHNVIPFMGELTPEPLIEDKDNIVLFGSYSMWKYAEKHNLRPGVFKLESFAYQKAWVEHSLNADCQRVMVKDIPDVLDYNNDNIFVRPIEDTKSIAGQVTTKQNLVDIARKVLTLEEDEIPNGSLSHNDIMLIGKPFDIYKEWRVWIVNDKIVTFSLYKEGDTVVYRNEIDDDAKAFVEKMINLNPEYSRAYVMDVCLTEDGIKLLETNCINASGFYAADLLLLANAIDTMNDL